MASWSDRGDSHSLNARTAGDTVLGVDALELIVSSLTVATIISCMPLQFGRVDGL
jgi:hypothetical protein